MSYYSRSNNFLLLTRNWRGFETAVVINEEKKSLYRGRLIRTIRNRIIHYVKIVSGPNQPRPQPPRTVGENARATRRQTDLRVTLGGARKYFISLTGRTSSTALVFTAWTTPNPANQPESPSFSITHQTNLIRTCRPSCVSSAEANERSKSRNNFSHNSIKYNYTPCATYAVTPAHSPPSSSAPTTSCPFNFLHFFRIPARQGRKIRQATTSVFQLQPSSTFF